MHRRLLRCIGRVIAMHFKTFKVPNAGHDWAASGTLHYIGMLHEIFTFLLMSRSMWFATPRPHQLRTVSLKWSVTRTVTCRFITGEASPLRSGEISISNIRNSVVYRRHPVRCLLLLLDGTKQRFAIVTYSCWLTSNCTYF